MRAVHHGKQTGLPFLKLKLVTMGGHGPLSCPGWTSGGRCRKELVGIGLQSGQNFESVQTDRGVEFVNIASRTC